MLPFMLALALQAGQATIVGSVKDAHTGAPLKAAIVALVDINRSVVTDATGSYLFTEIPAGPQHVSVQLVGYGSRTLHALVPASGKLVINVLLQAEPIPLHPLAVRARVAIRSAEPNQNAPYPERSASAAEVRNHPLLAEPDAFQVLGGGEVVIMPESPAGVHIRGGASDQTAYVLDGVPIFNPYHAAGLFSAWNPDALAQIRLTSSVQSPMLPDALSAVIAGVSRTPGSGFSAQGSFTTTQTRATIDGPIGIADGGYVLSLRSSYPGFIAPRDENTYLSGESGDLFAKVEARALDGELRMLAYDSENEIETAATTSSPNAPSSNLFQWHSRSLGIRWTRTSANTVVHAQAWHSESDASARWALDSAAIVDVNSDRRDAGLLLAFEHHARTATTSSGIRAVRSNTAYDVALERDAARSRLRAASTPVVSGFLGQTRELNDRIALNWSASIAAAAGGVHSGFHGQLRWVANQRIALSGSVARLHQFTQSLRNPESLVSNVFPVDLHVGAGDHAVPVARSDQVILSAEIRPRPGLRLALQGYRRTSTGLALVAVRDSQPFATTDVESGSGRSHGIALDFTLSSARFGVVGSYGWQHTRLAHADGSFQPEHAAPHHVEAGVIVFPGATTALRLGAVAAFGRHASLAIGAIEWEACNLLDRGCEFAGSPRSSPETLGRNRLPAYVRVDLGARKHWHIGIGRRDASLALFGTFTNVLGRKNVLNLAYDPATSQTTPVEMRPPSPLVLGIDWRF